MFKWMMVLDCNHSMSAGRRRSRQLMTIHILFPVCSYVGLTKYALINKELKSFFSISYLY